jgi:RIO-like serine/threonine protein kinase
MSVYGHKIIKQIQDNVFIIAKGILKEFQSVKSFNRECYCLNLLKQHDIMPKALLIDDVNMVIISELMHPVVDACGHLINKALLTPRFIDLLDRKISLLHSLGIAHGDLSSHNIVYNDNNEPFLIDFEKSFSINNHTLETKEWMTMFDWEDSYADFVNFDYINWRQFLSLPCDKAPRDYVRLEEEILHTYL